MTSDGSSTSPLWLILELLGVIGVGTALITYVTLKLVDLANPQRKELRQQRRDTRALRREQRMDRVRALSIWAEARAIRTELYVRRYFRYTLYQPRHRKGLAPVVN